MVERGVKTDFYEDGKVRSLQLGNEYETFGCRIEFLPSGWPSRIYRIELQDDDTEKVSEFVLLRVKKPTAWSWFQKLFRRTG